MRSHDLIICFITDDPALDHFFQKLVYPFNIQLLSMLSIQEALQQIALIPFDGCIIDSAISNGEKEDLFAHFAHKEMILLVKKPIKEAEVNQLFMKLLKASGLFKQLPSDPEIQELQANYAKTLPEKLDNLKNLINAVHVAPSIETLQNLRLAVHKLAGSAGTYGYWRVSQLCKTLESELISKINQGSLSSVPNLDLFLNQIKEGFKWQTQKNG